MSAFSPVAVLFDTNGREVTVEGGTAIPLNSPGLLVVGSDGTNARFIRMATDGTVRVDPTGTTAQPVTDNGGSLTVDDGGSSLTIDGSVSVSNFPATQDTNLIQVGGTAVTVGSGASGLGTLRVILATDQPVVPVSDNAGSLTVDDGGLSLTVDGDVSVNNFPGLQNVNVTQIGSTAVSVGSGLTNAGTLRVVLPTDQTVIPVSDNGGSLTVDSGQLPGALVGGRLDTNIGSWLGSVAPTVGQKGAVSSIPVVLASDQTVIPVSDNAGSLTVDDGGLSLTVDGSVSVSNFPGLQNVNVTQLGGIAITLGSGIIDTGTQRVVLATDQPVIPVADNGGSLTIDNTAIDTNLDVALSTRASEATVATLLTEAAFQARINTLGQKVMAASTPVVIASDQTVIPVSDNGGSLSVDDGGAVLSVDDAGGSLTIDTPQLPAALVGSRLDVNVGSWLGSTAPTVGQKLMVSSVPVVISSDQSAVPVTFTPADATTGVRSCYLTLGGGTTNNLIELMATAYTEQASAAQRSVASTSASDTSAGTGARTVEITYYDNSGNGPFTDTVTLNGTTPVNTTPTDIRFIERMEVLTSGSAGANVGTIQLYTATAGGGTVFGSIGVGNIVTGVGDKRTFWAHHYIATSLEAEFADLVVGIQASGTATSGRFFLQESRPLDTNATSILFDGVLLVQGSFNRSYAFRTSIAGFARVQAFVIPGANNSTVSCSFDFSEV